MPGGQSQGAPAYRLRAAAWGTKGEYDKAIADYNQALANNPELGMPTTVAATPGTTKGEYDKAIADN